MRMQDLYSILKSFSFLLVTLISTTSLFSNAVVDSIGLVTINFDGASCQGIYVANGVDHGCDFESYLSDLSSLNSNKIFPTKPASSTDKWRCNGSVCTAYNGTLASNCDPNDQYACGGSPPTTVYHCNGSACNVSTAAGPSSCDPNSSTACGASPPANKYRCNGNQCENYIGTLATNCTIGAGDCGETNDKSHDKWSCNSSTGQCAATTTGYNTLADCNNNCSAPTFYICNISTGNCSSTTSSSGSYTTLSACNSNCTASNPGYNCNNGTCSYSSTNGSYSSLSLCNSNCNSAGYNCSNGTCSYSSTNGSYSSLSLCN